MTNTRWSYRERISVLTNKAPEFVSELRHTYSDVCISTLQLGLVYTQQKLGVVSSPLLAHSCSAKARVRWNESESENVANRSTDAAKRYLWWENTRKTERDKISTRRLSRTVLARFQCLRSLSFHLALAFAGQEWDRSGGDSEKSVSCTPGLSSVGAPHALASPSDLSFTQRAFRCQGGPRDATKATMPG